MDNEKVMMLKMYNGDFIIGSVDEHSLNDATNMISVHNPRNFVIIPTMEGRVQVALQPICSPFKCLRLSKECELRRDQVMFMLNEDELDNEVVNGYKSEISGIKIATAAEAASIASSSKNNASKEFII